MWDPSALVWLPHQSTHTRTHTHMHTQTHTHTHMHTNTHTHTCRHNKGDNKELHARAVKDVEDWHGCVANQGPVWCLRHYNPQQLVKGMYVEVCVCGGMCLSVWCLRRHYNPQQLVKGMYAEVCVWGWVCVCLCGAGATTTHSSW